MTNNPLVGNDFEPGPDEHFAEIAPIENFLHDSFRREDVETGVVALIGDKQDGSGRDVYGYLFNSNDFSQGDVQIWVGARKIVPQKINPAKNSMFRDMTSGAQLGLIALPGELFIQASSAEITDPKCSILAYSGDVMNVPGWGPCVIDLAGLEIPSESIPLLADHDAKLPGIVGSGRPRIENNQLLVDGTIATTSAAGKQIVAFHKSGVRFGASVGLEPLESKKIMPGNSVTVNGKSIQATGVGFTLVRRGRLREISITSVAADPGTTVSIAASLNSKGNFMSTVTEQTPEQIRAAAFLETERVNGIHAVVDQQRKLWGDNLQPTIRASLGNLEARAISEGWDANKAELEILRASRPQSVISNSRGNDSFSSPQILEAAMYGHLGLEKLGEQALGANAMQAGRELRINSMLDVIKTSLTMERREIPQGQNEMIRAAFSSISLPGILSNVLGKNLLRTYQSFPSAARMIAKVLSAKDFKDQVGLRLTGDATLEKIAGTGEIKHGYLTDQSYPFKIETFAKTFGLTRQDVINDDLSAFSDIPQVLGRGSAIALEKAFWTLVLANTENFFHVDNNNYQSGSTTALSLDALGLSVAVMLKQVDDQGNPINVIPRFLVVPPELKALADSLYRSTLVVAGVGATSASDRIIPNANTFFGLYEPAVSPYISNAKFTGYSAKQWYLFGDPGDVAAFGIAYLNGAQNPIVEQAPQEPDILGLQWRAYFDFGVCQIDPRGAVYSKGET